LVHATDFVSCIQNLYSTHQHGGDQQELTLAEEFARV
jgi:hypothetical protein